MPRRARLSQAALLASNAGSLSDEVRRKVTRRRRRRGEGGQIAAAIWPRAAHVAGATLVMWAFAAAPAAAETWTWPVRGHVVAAFADAGGPYAAGQHRGIDVAAPKGAPVVAAAGGTVRSAGVVGSSGLTVSVRTADGRFDTSYLHLATAAVRAGQAVATGGLIGTAGTSGRPSTATPHLHFGVRDAGTRRYRDPLDLLPSSPGHRDAPRGVPVAPRVPVRLAPRGAPVAPRVPLGAAPHGAPVRTGPTPWPVSPRAARQPAPAAAPSRTGWAIACGALILAAVLLGRRSSIDARVVLRHHADLLRQR
jgi:murein DD-endopeptidase MepM/ murein hydrolase activator NlpD